MQPITRKKAVFVVLPAMLTAFMYAVHVQATLHDRGGGLIYDDVLDVTWLQDASYIQTSGFSEYPILNYSDAVAWVNNLHYEDSVRGTTWDDWRLPATVNHASSEGYDLTGESSELAYMYYVNLGYEPNYSPDPADPVPTSDHYNPFVNLAYLGYWSGTLSDNENFAWYFHFHFGNQYVDAISDSGYVWAVRDGDVCIEIPNGDINSDCAVNLKDVILVLRILSGMTVSENVNPYASVSGSGAIGMADAIHVLQHLATKP